MYDIHRNLFKQFTNRHKNLYKTKNNHITRYIHNSVWSGSILIEGSVCTQPNQSPRSRDAASITTWLELNAEALDSNMSFRFA